ncbi:arginase family protein, partial [Clostridioides difficile]|uniref:arginase family protein n=1 Tax=Clostridioides difficile TaxID=1496 RepID=UPI0023596F21
EKIQENFNLVVFDYHSDMQKPALGNILSCGSWVINSLETNRYLKNVILIGLGKKEKQLIDSQYKENVICIDKDSAYMWDDNKYKFENNPIYISIDKDVISEKVVDTN